MEQSTFEQFIEAFNAHDLDRVMEYFTEDAIYHSHSGPDPLGSSVTGRDAIRAALERRFRVTPDGRIVMTSAPLLTEEAGASDWYFEYPDADGQKRRIYGCDLFRFRGNRITSKSVYVKEHVPALSPTETKPYT